MSQLPVVIDADEATQLLDLVDVLASLPPAPDPSLDPYLDATARCLDRYGLAHTSVQDVAAEAGVSRSTVYRVAGTLDDLLQALMLRQVHRFLAAIPKLIVGKSGPDALVDTIATFIEGARAGPVLRKDLAEDPEGVGASLHRHFPDLLGQLTAWMAPMFEAGMQLELVAERDAALLAEWIARIAVSLILHPPQGDLRGFLAEVLVPALERPTAPATSVPHHQA